ncbi:PREDICTED: F-box/WD repeat-containing protein 12-like [Chrysochloris asiatica]|uniref:F-box/WD repeat-containing protein 12-like n=1 Tax=Chrysochloris asiatica TaxID=185453 RepID=A0A9B0TZT4_CHRAS|nr:PREDICTED: F-box/WD repeat-containing protein 12-like [Chrysochloris asiatica]
MQENDLLIFDNHMGWRPPGAHANLLYPWKISSILVHGVKEPWKQCIMSWAANCKDKHLAFTVDLEGTIKVWNCSDRDALAAYTMSQHCYSMEALLTKGGPFLMVGDREGGIYTFTVPDLTCISSVNKLRYTVELLICSPNQKWIFASGYDEHIFPMVFLTECLLKPSKDDIPLSLCISSSWCWSACWALKKTNRIAMIFRRDSSRRIRFTTFDFTTECLVGQTVIQAHKITSFMLPIHMDAPNHFGINDGNMIVFENGPRLLIFIINGLLLQEIRAHPLNICHLWMDPVHSLTTTMDNSLHVFMWEKEGCYPYLRKCCHLEQVPGDQKPSCFPPKAICDNMSIVCVVTKYCNSSILLMHSIRTWKIME